MRSRVHGRHALVAFLALTVTASAALAGEAVTPADANVSDQAIEGRIRFIEERLDARQTHGQVWFWSWMVVNGGAAIGLGIAAGLSDDNDDRVNNGVNAGMATLGVADLLLRPLDARLGAEPIRRLPAATRQEKIDKLRAAESLLRGNAERAEERTSWTMHGLNLAVATASGVAIGLAGDPTDAAISAAGNLLGGVLYILSAPAGPADDWQAYQRMTGSAAAEPDFRLSMAMLRGGGRIGVDYRW